MERKRQSFMRMNSTMERGCAAISEPTLSVVCAFLAAKLLNYLGRRSRQKKESRGQKIGSESWAGVGQQENIGSVSRDSVVRAVCVACVHTCVCMCVVCIYVSV